MANEGWVVQASRVELSFSHSPGPVVHCSRWVGGLWDGGWSGVNENKEAPWEARGRLSRIFNCTNF